MALKAGGFMLPLSGKTLIAVSGGIDSMVLAHLLARYGRRILDPSDLTLLHIDHGWRPESGSYERETVRNWASRLGVGFISRDFPPRGKSLRNSGNSEEEARLLRQDLYRSLAGPGCTCERVLTAHHRDDQAETVLFRFLRGELLELGSGILFKDGPSLRPFLQVTKDEIRAYAEEERVPFHEDSTNRDLNRFRAWTREKVLPLLEEAFPGVRQVLARYPARLAKQPVSPGFSDLKAGIEVLTAKPLSRAQVDALRQKWLDSGGRGRLSLPGGASIRRVKDGFLIENLDLPDPG
jgi:tRNA(Ile)-lysidine synthetase-like protein